MPTYGYRCDDGHDFEAVQPMSDPPLDVCEVCGAPARRLLFAPAIHFKGTGFHNTDYGTKKRPKGAEGADGGAPAPGGGAAAAESGGAASGGTGNGSGGGAREATTADTAKRATGP